MALDITIIFVEVGEVYPILGGIHAYSARVTKLMMTADPRRRIFPYTFTNVDKISLYILRSSNKIQTLILN